MIDYNDAQAVERQNVSPNAGCTIDGEFYDVRNLLHEVSRLTGALEAAEHTANGNRLAAEAVRGAERAGWNDAIAWVEKHLEDYVSECGSYDPETGVTELPDGGEWEGSVQDIIDGMRLAVPAALAADGEA